MAQRKDQVFAVVSRCNESCQQLFPSSPNLYSYNTSEHIKANLWAWEEF